MRSIQSKSEGLLLDFILFQYVSNGSLIFVLRFFPVVVMEGLSVPLSGVPSILRLIFYPLLVAVCVLVTEKK